MKTKGPVTEKEHTAFLNLWLEHFIFCGPSLAPTKNYLPLAYHLAHGNHTGLGKLFLGETYRYLYLMTSNLLNHKKLRTGGPWWFIQLWAQLYFQHHIPTSKAWPRTPSLMRVANQLDVLVMAKLYLVSLAVNWTQQMQQNGSESSIKD